MALAKTLMTMGLYPAPTIEELEPYPRPAPHAEADAKTRALALKSGVCSAASAAATAKVAQLQESLDAAKLKYPASVVEAFSKELLVVKGEQAKLGKNATAKTNKDALTQLEHRVEMADNAAEAANTRHLAQLAALDT